ncbi:hypothetical protein AYI70_g84 [Smittium culicis]|uniref:Uncharacterized protein n=1 Tax=Smittium culicis TaxID=133412 RepID=A0A1R1YHY2_9FUNG|nr:hypothetical protein AYI70_g84 [Smittium culicis]
MQSEIRGFNKNEISLSFKGHINKNIYDREKKYKKIGYNNQMSIKDHPSQYMINDEYKHLYKNGEYIGGNRPEFNKSIPIKLNGNRFFVSFNTGSTESGIKSSDGNMYSSKSDKGSSNIETINNPREENRVTDTFLGNQRYNYNYGNGKDGTLPSTEPILINDHPSQYHINSRYKHLFNVGKSVEGSGSSYEKNLKIGANGKKFSISFKTGKKDLKG